MITIVLICVFIDFGSFQWEVIGFSPFLGLILLTFWHKKLNNIICFTIFLSLFYYVLHAQPRNNHHLSTTLCVIKINLGILVLFSNYIQIPLDEIWIWKKSSHHHHVKLSGSPLWYFFVYSNKSLLYCSVLF